MSRLAHRPASHRPGEAGYNMVLLVVILTVMNIGLAAMLPSFTSTIQREKEEELVFRGLQYAEAIRVFQNRFQRLPVKLDELVEAQPRSIRQLWKDPMTEDGKWSLIFQGQDQQQPLSPQPEGRDPRADNGDQEPEDVAGTSKVPKPGDEVAVGPIIGVRSRSEKASFLVFNGRQRYDEWRFTIELLQNLGGARVIPVPGGGAGVPNAPANAQGMVMGGTVPQMNSRWIGRPFDQSLMPPGMNNMPGQNPGSLQGPNPNTLGGQPKPPQTKPIN